MREKISVALSLVLTSILTIGCIDAGVDVTNRDLVNTPWRLKSFEMIEGASTPIQNGRVYAITFSPDTTAFVRADCNDCLTTFSILPGAPEANIVVRVLACTEIYCGPESLDWRFLNGLRHATRYRIQGDLLRLYSKTEVLNFKPHE